MFGIKVPKISRQNLDLFRVSVLKYVVGLTNIKFGFYLMTPIAVMYYVGTDTDKKFNVPGFWPDPATLNKIPKERHEIQAELARMRQARLEKRKRLEEKARELGIDIDNEA